MANNPLSQNLPADLPTNWQNGQIVAPAGSSVGLSTQHGYNYLMQQENASQNAINSIGAAFSGVFGKTETIPVANGGTGGTSASVARGNLSVYSKTETDTAVNAVNSALSTHVANKSNPHAVTAAQVGAPTLSNGLIQTSQLPTIPTSKGGTGATTVANARSNLSVYSKSEVDAKVGSIANLEVGGYKGDGTHGTGDPGYLTFGFWPGWIIILPTNYENGYRYLIKTSSLSTSYTSGGFGDSNSYIKRVEGTTGIMWYSTSAKGQLNVNGETYMYIAIK